MLQHYRKLGHAGNPSLCWLEWAAAEECDIHDENVWYEAIPTLGEEHGVTIEAVREAVQTTEPSIFMSEWLNIWHTLKSQTVIEPAQWAALQRDNVVMGNFFCFGVDVSPNRDHASIASAGLNGAFQCLEVVESQNRIGWLKERILELHAKWGMPFVIDSGAAASSLIGELEAEGVHVIPITMRQYGQACGSFYDAVQEKSISHLGDARLQNAIEGATRRKLGEQWAWSRKTTGDVAITPLVAVTIARYALINNLANPTPKVAIH